VQVRSALATKAEEAEPPVRAVAAPVADGLRGERIMEVCEAMIDICAALYGVSSKELRSTGKCGTSVTRVRQIAMYVTHVALGIKMQDVGRGFCRDRTTVRYACQVIEDLRDDLEFDRTMMTTEQVALAAFRNRLEV
jgi:chromosomal replication initiation ATPase DnaA